MIAPERNWRLVLERWCSTVLAISCAASTLSSGATEMLTSARRRWPNHRARTSVTPVTPCTARANRRSLVADVPEFEDVG